MRKQEGIDALPVKRRAFRGAVRGDVRGVGIENHLFRDTGASDDELFHPYSVACRHDSFTLHFAIGPAPDEFFPQAGLMRGLRRAGLFGVKYPGWNFLGFPNRFLGSES
jgi:hypothetical protein